MLYHCRLRHNSIYMNFKIILLSISLLAISQIFAQTNLTGNISSDKKPVAGATVYLPDLKKGTLSDSAGNFSLNNLKAGTYLLTISSTGFKAVTEKVDFPVQSILNIELEPSAKELAEVIVTGVSRTTELKRSPLVIKPVNHEEVLRTNSTNLINALQTVPGISEITTGPNISKPIIRGLGANRVIVLNNGIKQEGQQWGDEHGIEIDEHSVDRVEVIKGPGSLMYGSDAIAGVINFLPAKPKNSTSAIINYQTNNNLLSYSLSNSGIKNDFNWSARFSNKFAGNYQNKYDGKVLNSGYKEYNGNISLGITKSRGNSTLTINSYNSRIGIVEGERDSLGRFVLINDEGEETAATDKDLKDYKYNLPYQIINHFSLSSNSYFLTRGGTINLLLGYQNNRRREFEEDKDPSLYMFLSTFNYNARYNFKRKNGWETSVGISGMFQSNNNKGKEFLIPDYNLSDGGLFLYSQKAVNKFSLAGGLRFDTRNIKSETLIINHPGEPEEILFEGFNKNFNAVSGSLGLSYQASKISTIKLNLSRGFRAPNIAELSSNGIHEGTFKYEIGNIDLKPEISHQLDFAYILNSEHLTFEFTPFVNFIKNYSFTEKLKSSSGNDSLPTGDPQYPAYKFISGKAVLSGGEVFVDIHPHPLDWLHIENTFSFVRGLSNNKTDSTRNLPFMPAPVYKVALKAEFKNINKRLETLILKAGLENYFPQSKIYSAYHTETQTPGYTLLNALLGAEINAFKKYKALSIFISANNLLNIAYQNHLSRLKYAGENPLTGRHGIYNMGRNFSIKMVMSI